MGFQKVQKTVFFCCFLTFFWCFLKEKVVEKGRLVKIFPWFSLKNDDFWQFLGFFLSFLSKFEIGSS
jgi:hypothetical protein